MADNDGVIDFRPVIRKNFARASTRKHLLIQFVFENLS